jgi:hypothetical protein
MFGWFGKFEKVVKTIRSYSYNRNGKKIRVGRHRRTVTRRKSSPSLPPLPPLKGLHEMTPQQQQRFFATKKRVEQKIQRRDTAIERAKRKAIQPKPLMSQKRWLRFGDIIEVFTGSKWDMMIVDRINPNWAYCIDYFSDGDGWGMYIWNEPEQAHLWRFAND